MRIAPITLLHFSAHLGGGTSDRLVGLFLHEILRDLKTHVCSRASLHLACRRALSDGHASCFSVGHSVRIRSLPGTPHMVAAADHSVAVVRPPPRVFGCWAGRQSYSWRGGGLVHSQMEWNITGCICLLARDPPPRPVVQTPTPPPACVIAVGLRRTFWGDHY